MESTRTCLACRKKAGKLELCRFVRALDGEICFDEKGDLPNRGAWICAKRPCLLKAFQKRLLFRGERTLPIDVETLVSFVGARIKKSALARLGLMRRIGHIETGMDAVKQMIADDKAYAVIFARDFSLRSMDAVKGKISETKKTKLMDSPFMMEEIGLCLGRKKTGVVALLKGRITDEILLQLRKLSEIEQ